MAEDFIAKKETIVLSRATCSAKQGLMARLCLPEKGASWPKKTTHLKKVDGFIWLEGSEDSKGNRTAYIGYLKHILQISDRFALKDTQPQKNLLEVELEELAGSPKISGTTDVIIAKSEHVNNDAIRNNIEALIELKTPKNLREKDHTPETICEHFAASYLNRRAVVSVLTDLNTKWTFFWFAESDSEAALYKLQLDGDQAAADATYLLNSLFSAEAFGDTLPTTFANRVSFQAVLKNHKRSRRDFDSDDSSSPEQDSKPSSSGGHDPFSGPSSKRSNTELKNNQGAPVNMASRLSQFAPPSERDVANELDLLDMVDEHEQYEIVRSFAAKHIVPYMRM
jgi:hypothetical protein